MLTFLLLVLTVGPRPETSDAALADFSRFSKSIAQEIAIADHDGTVREGILTAATADEVTIQFGAGPKTFARATVASAERVRDGKTDGLIKGAIFGAIMGVFTTRAGSGRAAGMVGNIAVYSGIGWLLDAANENREPIYLAPAAAATPKPSMAFSFRF